MTAIDLAVHQRLFQRIDAIAMGEVVPASGWDVHEVSSSWSLGLRPE
jgi:hypothetical protein